MEARTWKWLMPGLLMVALFVLGVYLSGNGLNYWDSVAFGAAGVLFIQAAAGFRAYYRTVETDLFIRRQNALSDTPETRMAEAMRQMHPTTAQIFVEHQKIAWLVAELGEDDICEWWLQCDPRINARFVEFFLNGSNYVSVMPMNRVLNDGAHTWSATTADRDMYRCLIEVLKRRHMITEAHGNQSSLWIAPWNPRTAAKRFGIPYGEDVKELEE